MPAKHIDTESDPSKQDPTERRRLQNRLSQRNHRRKIRDRIAKLQERVIASELRAAATLHGWHSAPCIPYEVKPSPSSASSSLSLSAPGSSSPPAELQCPPAASACSSYNLGLNPMTPLSVLPAAFDDGSTAVGAFGSGGGSGTSSPTTLHPPESIGINPGGSLLAGQGYALDALQMCEQWGYRGSVYLATDPSLPQILQTLGPSSSAVILVPSGYMGAEYQSQGLEVHGCQCQCQSVGWMGCPMHSMG